MKSPIAVLFGMLAVLTTGFSAAHATTIKSGFYGEPDLATPGGILDSFFGLASLERLDDATDGLWMSGGTLDIFSIGKYAGFDHDFGYLDGDDLFTSIIDNPDGSDSASFDIPDTQSPFRFTLKANRDKLLWSSLADDNQNSEDHMVSWLVLEGEYAGSFVFGWEDYRGLGDRDYNDLVLVISGIDLYGGPIGGDPNDIPGVPVPAALWLFGSGLLGLVGLLRRRVF